MPGRPARCPSSAPPRPLPVGSVLKRLGRSGLVVDGTDLRDALEPAYAAFAGRDSELATSPNAVRGAAAPLTVHACARSGSRRRRARSVVEEDDELPLEDDEPESAGGPKPRPRPGPPGPPWP